MDKQSFQLRASRRKEFPQTDLTSSQATFRCNKVAVSQGSSLPDLRAAFAHVLPLPMMQGWMDEPEEGFSPGIVRLGWDNDRLYVFADLDDEALISTATADNQPLWRLGDVFEIFLRDQGGERYAEFHIAPNGKRLQVIYPDAAANDRIGEGVRLEDFIVREALFEFRSWNEQGKWLTFATIPSSVFLPQSSSLAGRTWAVSFSRYDYSSAEAPPVLSSTSPHRVLSFHRQEEWALIYFSD